LARVLAATQRPASSITFTQQSGVPAWKTIPSWAVFGSADHAIPPAELLAMARRAHAHITIIPGAPHLSMIADPGIVTQVILHAACATTLCGRTGLRAACRGHQPPFVRPKRTFSWMNGGFSSAGRTVAHGPAWIPASPLRAAADTGKPTSWKTCCGREDVLRETLAQDGAAWSRWPPSGMSCRYGRPSAGVADGRAPGIEARGRRERSGTLTLRPAAGQRRENGQVGVEPGRAR
jgi:hypothetical protein